MPALAQRRHGLQRQANLDKQLSMKSVMMYDRRLSRLILIFVALVCVPAGVRSQTLEAKLEQQTRFVPQTASPVEQLVEVAQKFRLPMAVEWLEDSDIAPLPDTAAQAERPSISVRKLIEELVNRSTAHRVEIEGGLVHVFAPSVVLSRFNFLNIQVESIHLEDANLFDAEADLRTAINLTLYPEEFKDAYVGGHGYPSDHVFTIGNITFAGEDMTIREILNRITEGNGNALWVVRLKRNEFAARRPYWQGKPLDEYGHSPVNGRWDFIPLADITRLAAEQVAVELTFDGFAPEKKIVIPVMTEHGLSGDTGGYTGVFTEDRSYGYGVTVSQVGKDAVTLTIAFKIKPPHESEKSFQETVTVSREKPVELQLDEGVKIKAYFEPRH
jgi:hypothetical protein